MVSFTSIYIEALDQSYPYTWMQSSPSDGKAVFTTENDSKITFVARLNPQTIDLDNSSYKVHEIAFSADGSFFRKDTGNPLKVFATIQKLMEEYVGKFHSEMDSIAFSARKSGKDSRGKLYMTFSKRLMNILKGNWIAFYNSKGMDTQFFLFNTDNVTPDHLKEIVKKNKLKSI